MPLKAACLRSPRLTRLRTIMPFLDVPSVEFPFHRSSSARHEYKLVVVKSFTISIFTFIIRSNVNLPPSVVVENVSFCALRLMHMIFSCTRTRTVILGEKLPGARQQGLFFFSFFPPFSKSVCVCYTVLYMHEFRFDYFFLSPRGKGNDRNLIVKKRNDLKGCSDAVGRMKAFFLFLSAFKLARGRSGACERVCVYCTMTYVSHTIDR